MVTIIDVNEILKNKIQESQKLEYKGYVFEDGKFNSLGNKQKLGLLKEICSFANANGGTIVLGIAEDDNHNPIKTEDTGVNGEMFEAWVQSFMMSCGTKIRPVLHGISCDQIQHGEDSLIVISVPKSILKPHALFDGNKHEFYIRYGNLCKPMGYDELKKSFIELDTIQSRVYSFIDDRLSMILNDEIVSGLDNETILVIHTIPHWSMGMGNNIDFEPVIKDSSFDVFSPVRSTRYGKPSYNIDGLMFLSESSNGINEPIIQSYSQVFNHGAVETVEVRMMNRCDYPLDDKYIYDWDKLEVLIYDKVVKTIKSLVRLEIPKPYSICVSILNAKGKFSKFGAFKRKTTPFNRDIIKIPPVNVSEYMDVHESLMPLFVNIAHSLGLKSPISDKLGGREF